MKIKEAIKTLTGTDAIRYAQRNPEAVEICKYTDPVEEARWDITPEEAWDVAREDPSLIYLEER